VKKYKVSIFTTSPDLLVDCIMDEEMISDFLPIHDEEFISIEDDVREVSYMLNVSQIVGIQCKEVKNDSH
jgi:hypothetical protein